MSVYTGYYWSTITIWSDIRIKDFSYSVADQINSYGNMLLWL